VCLEEDLEKPAAKLRDHPILEAAGTPAGREAGARIGERAAQRLHPAQLEERPGTPWRVAAELSPVVDARRTPPQEQVVRQDLGPQVFDLFRFGKEAVATYVEMESFVLLCARNAPHVARIALQDRRRDALLAEEVCGGQAGGAGADDRNFRFVHLRKTRC